jgi:hypothetical protein
MTSLLLLDLVLSFRFQCTTLGSDQAYALRDLLPAYHLSLILSLDYGHDGDEAYAHPTVSYNEHNTNLAALLYATKVEMQDGLLANVASPFRSSGAHSPLHAIDFHDRVQRSSVQ